MLEKIRLKLQKTKLFIKSLIIILPLLVINFLYLNSDYRSDTLKFKNVPYGIQVANTGSSHEELGINYEFLNSDSKTFNFALGAQTFLYDNHILDEYISHFAPDSVLLVAVSKTSLTSSTPKETIEKYKYRYNQFLSKKNIENWTINEYIIDKYFPVFSSKHPFRKIDQSLRKIANKIKRKAKKIAGHTPKTSATTAISQTELSFADKAELEQMNQILWKIKDWDRLFPYAGSEGFEENLANINKILKKCHENRITPVLLSMPITKAMSEDYENVYKAFTPTHRSTEDDYKLFISEIKKNYPEIQVLDYTKDEDLTGNYLYYMDVDHLNSFGAKVFSEKLFADLRKLNLIK